MSKYIPASDIIKLQEVEKRRSVLASTIAIACQATDTDAAGEWLEGFVTCFTPGMVSFAPNSNLT